MRKLFFIISIVIIIITISIKVNYHAHITLSFGNNIKSNYVYHYHATRVNDVIDDIKKNIKINDRCIQNILVVADNIYIDLNELEVDQHNFDNLNELLNIMRIYTKEKITVILKEERNSYDSLINNWIFKIKDKYDIIIRR